MIPYKINMQIAESFQLWEFSLEGNLWWNESGSSPAHTEMENKWLTGQFTYPHEVFEGKNSFCKGFPSNTSAVRRQLANVVFSFFSWNPANNAPFHFQATWEDKYPSVNNVHSPQLRWERKAETENQIGPRQIADVPRKRWKLWLSKWFCPPSPRVTTFQCLSV